MSSSQAHCQLKTVWTPGALVDDGDANAAAAGGTRGEPCKQPSTQPRPTTRSRRMATSMSMAVGDSRWRNRRDCCSLHLPGSPGRSRRMGGRVGLLRCSWWSDTPALSRRQMWHRRPSSQPYLDGHKPRRCCRPSQLRTLRGGAAAATTFRRREQHQKTHRRRRNVPIDPVAVSWEGATADDHHHRLPAPAPLRSDRQN